MRAPSPDGHRVASALPHHDDLRGYRLDLDAVTVDLHACRSLLARATTAGDAQALTLTRRALLLCEQPLLASETRAGWADQARDEFHHGLAVACARASGLRSRWVTPAVPWRSPPARRTSSPSTRL